MTNTQQSLKSRSAVGGTVMSRGIGHSYAPYKKPAVDVRHPHSLLHSVLGTIAGLNRRFLANVNSSSGSLYVVVVRLSSVVCRLSVVCNVRAPYSGD